MEKPFFSIIIPTYNYGKYIQSTLRSIFTQTFKNFEVILVDDGSKDTTEEMIKDFLPIIRYFKHKKNRGFAETMNTGVSHAQGKYLTILSSDDILKPKYLEKSLRVLEKYPNAGIVYSPVIFINSHGKIIGQQKKNPRYFARGDEYLRLLLGNYMYLVSVVAKTELVKKAGKFKSSLSLLPDWDMWLRIVKNHPVAYIPEYLCKYRIHPRSITSDAKRNIEKIGLEKLIVLEETIMKSPPQSNLWKLSFVDAYLQIPTYPPPVARAVAVIGTVLRIAFVTLLRLRYPA